MPVTGSDGIDGVRRAFGVAGVRRDSAKPISGPNADGGTQAPDDVALSTVAKTLASIRSAPDIRQDRVDELKQAIADGTYEVSSRELAESLIAAGAI